MRDVEREITMLGQRVLAAGLLREREPDALAHGRVEHAGERIRERRVALQHRRVAARDEAGPPVDGIEPRHRDVRGIVPARNGSA